MIREGEGRRDTIPVWRGRTEKRANRVIVAVIGYNRTRAAQAAAETRSRFNKRKHKITHGIAAGPPPSPPCPCSAYMRFVKRNFRNTRCAIGHLPVYITDCRFPAVIYDFPSLPPPLPIPNFPRVFRLEFRFYRRSSRAKNRVAGYAR